VAINRPTQGAAIGEQPAASAPHWLNAERVRVYSWMIVAIFAVVFIVWVGLSLPDFVDPRGKPIGCDFMEFWSAARLALEGRPEAAFDGAAITAVQHAAVPFLPNIWLPWHYPPTFLLVVVPLGLLPYPAALAAFALSTAVLWAALVPHILPDRRAWIVAAAAPAGLINLIDGQNGLLTAALAGFALVWLERRPVAAGILIGLLAVKPHLALLFPLALLAEGRWRSIAAAAATVLALCAASLVAFGWASWAAFLDHLPISLAMIDQATVLWGKMASPFGFARSLGAPEIVARVLQGAVALFAAGCVWRVWRRRGAPFEAKAATLLAGSLLVSPYMFYYDLTWAALAIAWLAKLALRDGFERGEREIFLFAWLAPALMPPVQLLTSVQLGFPAVLLLLVAAVRRAATAPRLAGAALAPPPSIAGSG
jgi:glycosyl transferase family 87